MSFPSEQFNQYFSLARKLIVESGYELPATFEEDEHKLAIVEALAGSLEILSPFDKNQVMSTMNSCARLTKIFGRQITITDSQNLIFDLAVQGIDLDHGQLVEIIHALDMVEMNYITLGTYSVNSLVRYGVSRYDETFEVMSYIVNRTIRQRFIDREEYQSTDELMFKIHRQIISNLYYLKYKVFESRELSPLSLDKEDFDDHRTMYNEVLDPNFETVGPDLHDLITDEAGHRKYGVTDYKWLLSFLSDRYDIRVILFHANALENRQSQALFYYLGYIETGKSMSEFTTRIKLDQQVIVRDFKKAVRQLAVKLYEQPTGNTTPKEVQQKIQEIEMYTSYRSTGKLISDVSPRSLLVERWEKGLLQKRNIRDHYQEVLELTLARDDKNFKYSLYDIANIVGLPFADVARVWRDWADPDLDIRVSTHDLRILEDSNQYCLISMLEEGLRPSQISSLNDKLLEVLNFVGRPDENGKYPTLTEVIDKFGISNLTIIVNTLEADAMGAVTRQLNYLLETGRDNMSEEDICIVEGIIDLINKGTPLRSPRRSGISYKTLANLLGLSKHRVKTVLAKAENFTKEQCSISDNP